MIGVRGGFKWGVVVAISVCFWLVDSILNPNAVSCSLSLQSLPGGQGIPQNVSIDGGDGRWSMVYMVARTTSATKA